MGAMLLTSRQARGRRRTPHDGGNDDDDPPVCAVRTAKRETLNIPLSLSFLTVSVSLVFTRFLITRLAFCFASFPPPRLHPPSHSSHLSSFQFFSLFV